MESFNSFKSHYAQKSLKFATSSKIRYLIAALSWNDRTWAFDFVKQHIDSDNIMSYVKNIYKNLVNVIYNKDQELYLHLIVFIRLHKG